MARGFNGSSQWISGASAPGNVANNARTLACWVRTTNNATRQFIFLEGDDSSTYTRFAMEIISVTFKFTFNIRSANYQGTTTPNNDTWYHIAETYNSGTHILYVNGTQEKTDSGLSLGTTTTNFELGRYHGGSLYLTGAIAEAAKWNVALSADDVAALAKGVSPRHVQPQLLSFYAPLIRNVQDEDSALVLTDNGPTTAYDHPRIYA